jgi:tetratricopeptide (TPR) repeat protein
MTMRTSRRLLELSLASSLAAALLAPTAVQADDDPLARGLALAREGRYEEALPWIRAAVARAPSAEVECHEAVVLLRLSRLSAARLAFDRATSRPEESAPAWCAADLGRALSDVIATSGLQPLTLEVTPSTATTTVRAGTTTLVVDGVRTVWLPPGPATLSVAAGGFVSTSRTIQIGNEVATAQIHLRPVAAQDDPAAPARRRVERTPLAWRPYLALAVASAATAVGIRFHLQATSTRASANQVLDTSVSFADRRGEFRQQRAIAVAGYGLAAGALVWFVLERRFGRPEPIVTFEPVAGGATATVGSAW